MKAPSAMAANSTDTNPTTIGEGGLLSMCSSILTTTNRTSRQFDATIKTRRAEMATMKTPMRLSASFSSTACPLSALHHRQRCSCDRPSLAAAAAIDTATERRRYFAEVEIIQPRHSAAFANDDDERQKRRSSSSMLNKNHNDNEANRQKAPQLPPHIYVRPISASNLRALASLSPSSSTTKRNTRRNLHRHQRHHRHQQYRDHQCTVHHASLAATSGASNSTTSSSGRGSTTLDDGYDGDYDADNDGALVIGNLFVSELW